MSQYIKEYFNGSNPPKKLMIFLHGYNGNIEDIKPAADFFSKNIDNLLVATPQSDMISEKNPSKNQWYSLWKFDPHDERRNNDTSLDKLIDIYNLFGNSLDKSAKEINLIIDDLQKKYNIENQNTIIAGFSQGAMLACFTALSRQNFNGTCLMFSGVVAGSDKLAEIQKSTPKTILLHGKDDIVVNYKTLDFSIDWLNRHHVQTKDFRYEGLAHKLSEQAFKDALSGL